MTRRTALSINQLLDRARHAASVSWRAHTMSAHARSAVGDLRHALERIDRERKRAAFAGDAHPLGGSL